LRILHTKRKPEEYSSVQKAIEILLSFPTSSQEVRTLELSQRLNLHKSTVSRLLHILVHYGLLQQDNRTKKYVLGKSALDLGIAAQRYIDSGLIATAQSCLNELRDRVGELVSLEVISGKSSTVVCHAASTLPVLVSSNIGQRLPVYAVAGAKSILAFLPRKELDELIGHKKLKPYTANTITDPGAFRLHLEEIRKQGFSIDRGEYLSDVHAIGAPVFNADGRPIAAVVMPVPAYRMESHLRSNGPVLVKKTAANISATLFFGKRKT
jgi:IclR family acetate operon transcriptional repressor